MKLQLTLVFLTLWVFSNTQELPYSLQLYSLRDSMATSPANTLVQVRDWGFTSIEGSDTYGLGLEEYKDLLSKYKLNTLSVAVSFEYLEANIHTALDSIVAVAHFLNSNYIACYWIPHEIGNFKSEDILKAAHIFSEAGSILAKKGIQLCFHPHWYEFAEYEGATYLDYLMNHTLKSEMLLELDVFWVKHAGYDPIAVMEKYRNRIEIIHIKDRNIALIKHPAEPADPESSTILGTGDIPIKQILEKVQELGIKYVVLEDESSKSYMQIPQSIEYMRSIGY